MAMSRRLVLKENLKLDLRAYANSIGVTLSPPQDLIDSEERVWERALRPILLKLGYSADSFVPKPAYAPEIVGARREVDWGIYSYETIHRRGKFINLFGMVVDLKRHGVQLTYRHEEKLCGYCALFNSKYGILANDVDLVILKPTKGAIDWDFMHRIPTKAELEAELRVKPVFTPSDRIFAIRIASLEELDEKTVEKIATDCNNLIRRRKGMWSKKRQYEFSKLLLLRIQDERDFVDDKKKELELTSENIKNLRNRGVNIQAYFNSLFQSLSSNIGIFPTNEELELDDGVIEETIGVLDVHALWLKKMEMLGQIYERFLMQTMTGRELGEYFTPRSLVNLTIKMVDPDFGQTILDPACGTGGFLIYSLYHMEEKSYDKNKANPLKLHGIEIDEDTHKLAKINSWLHNDSHQNIIRADSLDPEQSPLFLRKALKNPEQNGLDIELTNPPFGATGKNKIPTEDLNKFSDGWRNLGSDLFECGINQKDVIPQSAFLELCIKSLKKPEERGKGGRLGTIIDFGIFSNIRNEEPVIRRIVRNNTVIEAIIGLPKGAFKMYGSNVIPCILILRRKHDLESQGPIFRADIQKIGYVSGASRFRPSSDEDIKILEAYWTKWSISKGIRHGYSRERTEAN